MGPCSCFLWQRESHQRVTAVESVSWDSGRSRQRVTELGQSNSEWVTAAFVGQSSVSKSEQRSKVRIALVGQKNACESEQRSWVRAAFVSQSCV